jgi:hypothetical protein
MELKQKSFPVFLKRSAQRVFLNYGHTSRYVQVSGQQASDRIRDLLLRDEPVLICRFGSTELQCIAGFLRESKVLRNFKWYNTFHWQDLMDNLCDLSGFFPRDPSLIHQFCRLSLEDMRSIDLLGSWRKEEYYLQDYIQSVPRIRLRDLEPYFHTSPWTSVLAGKKVLVIHPFETTIRSQYEKRAVLFKDPRVLPDFELKTIKAVQSIAGTGTGFATWFDALRHMQDQTDACDYDIALIGCGAYGFPLAAHVKRSGKKAVHIGGALQLMFGIMGKRWETKANILALKNDHWVYPGKEESPKNKDIVEGGCYW